MVTRRVRVRARDVVFLKGIVEAGEGLAQVFAERGGELTLASPAGRARELDELVEDLCRELGALRIPEPPAGDGALARPDHASDTDSDGAPDRAFDPERERGSGGDGERRR